MSFKRYTVIFFVLICLIVSISLLTNFLTTNRKIKLGLTNFEESSEIENDLISVVKRLTDDKKEKIVGITEKDVCYWIRSTRSGKNYLLEIKKYRTTIEKCFGLVLDETQITLENGINIMGDTDCLCSGNSYQLKWENGLKIIEYGRSTVKISSKSSYIEPSMITTSTIQKNMRISSTITPTNFIEKNKIYPEKDNSMII